MEEKYYEAQVFKDLKISLQTVNLKTVYLSLAGSSAVLFQAAVL